MRKIGVPLLLCWCVSQLVHADDRWPSPEQIEIVKEKQATMPWQDIVSAVDWYSPLEDVPGSDVAPLPIDLDDAQHYQAAERLAQAHNSYAFLVWRDGAIRYERYWPGFSQSSKYDTASMHKTVVALLLGAAVADGYISSVDAVLNDFITDIQPAALGQVSLRSLLEMSSGMTSPPFSPAPESVGMQTYLGDDLREAYSHWPMSLSPNSEFYYANVNPQYLGWAIENATGKRYAQYLSQRLWQPLGAGPARVWLDHENGSPRTSCCLQASARDWLRIGLLIMNRGEVNGKQVIPAQWVDNMLKPSPLNANYGWLIWRGSPHNPARQYSQGSAFVVPAEQPFKADDVYFLDGSGAQRVYIIPSQKTIIVRIGQPSQNWDDSELPNLILN